MWEFCFDINNITAVGGFSCLAILVKTSIYFKIPCQSILTDDIGRAYLVGSELRQCWPHHVTTGSAIQMNGKTQELQFFCSHILIFIVIGLYDTSGHNVMWTVPCQF